MVYYTKADVSAWSGEIDYLTDVVKCALFDDTFVPDRDGDQYFADLSGGELSDAGTGYVLGGVTVTGKTITPGTAETVLDCDNPYWSSLTVATVRYCVFYVSTGNDATSPLISYHDFGTNYNPIGQPVTAQVSPSGLASLQVVT